MMGGSGGNYGHLAQSANPNIADPMQNMNRAGFPNARRNTMGGAGQGGGAPGGPGPQQPMQRSPGQPMQAKPQPGLGGIGGGAMPGGLGGSFGGGQKPTPINQVGPGTFQGPGGQKPVSNPGAQAPFQAQPIGMAPQTYQRYPTSGGQASPFGGLQAQLQQLQGRVGGIDQLRQQLGGQGSQMSPQLRGMQGGPPGTGTTMGGGGK